jgi:hypothetical protein
MELIALYITMLKDPTIPGNRVVRKTAGLTLIGVVFLIYYRHVELDFSFGQPALVTIGLCLLAFIAVGIFGGVIAGAFYTSFLDRVGAQNKQLSAPVFFAEWLFAVASPLFGFGVLSIAAQDTW